MQPKYGSKVNLCQVDTGSFVYEIETENFYRDVTNNIETNFDAS